MLPSHKGSIHLFRFLGINVFLHWSWFLVAVIQVSYRAHLYSSYIWCLFEYLALFAIVLMHEFGHSLACRSVGGKADQIVLWPLGGVAFVDPPQRPGANLWSLAAGPLVNALLIPVLSIGVWFAHRLDFPSTMPNLNQFLVTLWIINIALLLFNLLPIYPLDGGQILRSLLWFLVGRARSLMIASTIGMIAVALLLLFAIRTPWLGILGAFALIQCWSGLQQARLLARVEAVPRRAGLACPGCHQAPPGGDFWICGHCRRAFDMFVTQGTCPGCGAVFNGVRCLECGNVYPFHAFFQV
jgi:Zn-dependent protease